MLHVWQLDPAALFLVLGNDRVPSSNFLQVRFEEMTPETGLPTL